MARRRWRERGDPGGELRPLSDLVMKAYPRGTTADLMALRAIRWWERAVPERVARNARPVRVHRGVLIVHAVTTVWAAELDFLSQDLLERLLRVAPDCGVRSIRVRVGALPPVPPPRRRGPAPGPLVPATELPEELGRALARVRDDDVRDAVTTAASTALGRRGRRGGS